MSRRLLVASLVALSVLPLATSNAQVSLGIAGGPSMPMGDFGKGVNSGYHVSGLAALSAPLAPVSLRFEGSMDQFDYKTAVLSGTSVRVLSATANVLFSPGGGIGPYLIGGLGLYNTSNTCSSCSSSGSNKVGMNGGAGFNLGLGGLGVFFEARLHYVSQDGSTTQFVPLSVGIKF